MVYLLCKFQLEKSPQSIINECTYIFSYRRFSHFYDIHARFARKKIIQVLAHQYKIAAQKSKSETMRSSLGFG